MATATQAGANLGQLLFGKPDTGDDFFKGQVLGAQVQSAMETARLNRAKAITQEGQNTAITGLGDVLPSLGIAVNAAPGAARLLQAGGGNADQLSQALGNLIAQGYQGDARTAALAGDLAGANANLFGLAKGPVDLTKITDGVAYNPVATPDQTLNVTPVGQADIASKLGQAANASFKPAIPNGDGTTSAGFIDPVNRTFSPLTMAGGATGTAPTLDSALGTLSQVPGVTMTSGVRTPAHNAEVGGVPNSQHLAGTAADYVVPPAEKPAFTANATQLGYQVLDEGDHLHVQQPHTSGGIASQALGLLPKGQRLPFGTAPAKAAEGDTFAKNKAFADQLQAAGAIKTPEEYQQVLTTGKVNSDFQGNSNVKPFGDETKTGADYVASLTGGNADIVKGLLNGTVQLPTGTALKNGFWQSALASVKHADPTWNQAAYAQFANTRKYMTTGQGGKLINSINTGAQHLQKLVEDINALDNSNARPLAAAGNYLSSNFGGQAVTNFMGDLTPVASELASIYKNGGTPTDQETQHWREALGVNMSRGQQLNVVRGWIDLLAGKLNATHDQYRDAMSPLSEPLNVINPEASRALAEVTKLANSVSTTGQHGTPAMDQTPVNAPGQQLPGAPATIPTPTTDAEYAALPSGATFIDPDDGKTYRKP